MGQPAELRLKYYEFALKFLGSVAALLAFLVGVKQYEKAQTWQRAHVVLQLIESFESRPQLRIARNMLDLDAVDIEIEDDASSRLEEHNWPGQPPSSRHILHFTNAILPSALRVVKEDKQCNTEDRSKPPGCFTADEMKMRRAFDEFFDFFEKLYALRHASLIEREDLAYFDYWLELVRGASVYKSDEARNALMAYLDAYRFRGFERLLTEYSLDPSPLDLPTSNTGPPDTP